MSTAATKSVALPWQTIEVYDQKTEEVKKIRLSPQAEQSLERILQDVAGIYSQPSFHTAHIIPNGNLQLTVECEDLVSQLVLSPHQWVMA